MLLLSLVACGSSVEDHAELKSSFEGCGYTTCGKHHPQFGEGGTLSCLLQRATADEAGHLEVSVAGDGASCGDIYDVYLGADGTAYVLLQTDLSCDEEVSLERCNVRDGATLQSCLDELEGFESNFDAPVPCGRLEDWLEGCVSVDDGSCS